MMTSSALPSPQLFPEILGYSLTEQLYLGSRTAVYRAVQTATQTPMVIKVLREDYPSFSELVQFRNQYAITQNLPIPGIIHPLGLESVGKSYALVMEDWGGVALSSYLQQQPLTPVEVLEIAHQLADILHDLGQHRVVHKDLKPANILIQPESQQVKLIDFSIASLLPKETQEIQSANTLEGTLAYLAPEQTGRMNRGIDYRTDFYALGVTLYQLLSGQLPFESEDPLELVHCHIAKQPLPVDQVNPEVPGMVAAIVAKLMAKNAEDRYQSALGLKHDLQQCLSQWQSWEEIVEFTLGERDVSDRFIIPEKLYGRETEVQALLDAFERVSQGASELMLVAGFSGIGKTAVVNEVHKPIAKQRGYFIKGKFDQFNRNIPFSAFVQAFRDLMGQLLGESDAQLRVWKAKILKALGDSGQVLIEVIPELECIIGAQPPAPELSGTAAQNRFNLLFQKFIAVFTQQAHPLTLFLDDLQWADSASLNLIQVLVGERQTGYLLLLGAYRDNEVFPAHPLMLTLGELKKQQTRISTITLTPLSTEHINQLVAETLSCTLDLAAPLTALVYEKTQGNPFFTTQFLKGLHEDGLIAFDLNLGYWQCDLVPVREAALTDDVVAFMAGRLHKFPTATQTVLKLAACIGNQFDLDTLAIICETSADAVATDLWPALQEGLILPLSEAYKFFQGGKENAENTENIKVGYRFLHDRVQQAAYSLIPDAQKHTTHYQIGQQLRQNTPPDVQEDRIFELVGQLNYGIELLCQTEEKEELARLNLVACRKAKSATAYQAGRDYATAGLALLDENPWQNQYEIAFAFAELAAELAALCGDWDAMEHLIADVVANSRSLMERAQVYRIQIQAYASRYQFSAAIAIALDFLQQLGITFPEKPTDADIAHAFAEVRDLIGDRPVEDLFHLPAMQDVEKLAILQTANSIIAVAYISSPRLFPLVVCLAVSLSIQYGNQPPSAFAHACYGMLLATSPVPDVITGVKFGELALQLVDKFAAKTAKTEVLVMAGAFLLHRTSALRAILPLLQAGYTSALETGNYEFAGYNAHHTCSNAFWCGRHLETLAEETGAYCHALEQLNQLTTANYARIVWQTSLNLLEGRENPAHLSGDALQEAEALRQWQTTNDGHGLFLFHTYKLMLCYLFGDLEAAHVQMNTGRQLLLAATGTVYVPAFHFYAALSTLAELQPASEEAATVLQQADTDLVALQHWADNAPMNYQHKCALIQAEKSRVLGHKLDAIELYDHAIAGAKANDYIQEAALANELAAKFYLAWGKEQMAASYLQKAYYGYTEWGAKAKIDDLAQRYPHLLRPILEKVQPFNPLETLATLAAPHFSLHTSTQTSRSSSSSSINGTLDLAAVLRASQSLSSTIQLDALLHQLSQIILQNSGADRCALILSNPEGDWEVRAIATPTDTQLCHARLQDNPDVPTKLIYFVKNTQETVVIDDGETDLPVMGEYLSRHCPQSVLCLPILNQGNLIGILYLQNQLTSSVFTSDRILILNFLCTQAAISLENARLYQQAQTYAQQLEQSQLQIVQSEKMASLGNLVAGVAHEINNPIGFLNGSINNGKEYVQDLLGHLALYQQHHPNAAAAVQDNAEDIDLEFLSKDLPKLLDSMQGATDRITSISTSLRTFSRADTEYKVRANLHEGLDSTLLILKYRLKANEYRPAITVIQNYGEIPAIECFPGQLNQVFMNILANAIDMFDEGAQQSSFESLQDNPQQITIQTILSNDAVEICIQDNGKGMTEEVKSKIFDHLFTTKGVGRGTGLGLAISRQIVEEKHGGRLEVQSLPGQGTEFCLRLPIVAREVNSA